MELEEGAVVFLIGGGITSAIALLIALVIFMSIRKRA
jgi:hypothetical protein